MSLTLERLARALLPRVPPGAFFSPLERQVSAAPAEVMLRGSPVPPPPDQVVRTVEQFLLVGRSRRAWRVRVLCVVVELAPVFLLFTRRFTRLSLERRA